MPNDNWEKQLAEAANPMPRSVLDTLGCQAPGCTHQDHSGVFYIHGRLPSRQPHDSVLLRR